MVALSWIVRRSWLVLSLAMLALVTYGSLSPSELLPDVISYDKARHFLAYGAVALPIAAARPRGWLWMLAGVLAWSAAIELIQPDFGRDEDFRDFLANALGVSLAVLAAIPLRRAAGALRPRTARSA